MMMQSTFGLFASEPANDDWVDREQWEQVINSLRGQYPKMTALESKAVYVFGMMRHLLEAAGWALDHPRCCNDGMDRYPQPFHFPAYELACGAAELLGRCAMGEGDPLQYQMALRRGLERMIDICPCCHKSNPRGAYSETSWRDDERHIIVRLNLFDYTIGDCKRFRNFMAHGAGDPKGDLLLLPGFVTGFILGACRAMDRYYGELTEASRDGNELRVRLAKAKVLPLWSGSRPLFVEGIYSLLCQPGTTPGGALLHEKPWRER